MVLAPSFAGAALAQDLSLPLKASPPALGVGPASNGANAGVNIELYSGVDSASRWFLGWTEATIALGDTDASGLRFRLYGEDGRTMYNSDAGSIITQRWVEGDLLVGYAFVREDFDVELYVGVGIISAALSSPDPTNTTQGTRAGPKVAGEFEWKRDHLLIAGEAGFTTAFNTYDAKLKFGIAFIKNIYIGPEFTELGDISFNQWRIGAHVTAMEINGLNIAVGAGYENDSGNGPGAYGNLAVGREF